MYLDFASFNGSMHRVPRDYLIHHQFVHRKPLAIVTVQRNVTRLITPFDRQVLGKLIAVDHRMNWQC
jgi:hypothetical protein